MIRFAKLLSLFLLVTLTSCFEETNFPDTPQIEFQSLEFRGNDNDIDSLILTFEFEDGGANLGLNPDDIFFPNNEFFVFLDEDDSIITSDNVEQITGTVYIAQLITSNILLRGVVLGEDFNEYIWDPGGVNHAVFAFEKEEFEGEVSLASFECPNIFNQDIGRGRRTYGDGSGTAIDVYTIENTENGGRRLTFYETSVNHDMLVLPVETHNNFFITFEELINGNPEIFDFKTALNSSLCTFGDFDGRIPWFDQEGQSGTITYNISSEILDVTLQDREFRLRFNVVDRAGNFSNEVTTEFMLLSDLVR